MLCQFFFAWADILSEKNAYFGKHLFWKTRTGQRVQTSFVYRTSRLVRISLLVSALNKRVLLFFSGKLFHKSDRKLFSFVCIAWYKHARGWENSRQLCKPSTSSRVCITVSNSPNRFRVYIRLCKHGKRFLLLKYLDVYTRSIYSLLPIDILAYGEIIKSYFLKTFITDELRTRLEIHIYIFIN